MMEKRCSICGKKIPFSIAKSQYHYNVTKYCSEKCRSKANSRYVCKRSKEKTDWKPLKLKCPVCQKEFIQKVSNQKYCSYECGKRFKSFEWQIKNVSKLQDKFLKLRFEVFKRDDFTCQYCGRNVKEDKIKLHCDHIIPKQKKGRNTPKNLITSCEECNEGKKDVLLTQKLLKPLSRVPPEVQNTP